MQFLTTILTKNKNGDLFAAASSSITEFWNDLSLSRSLAISAYNFYVFFSFSLLVFREISADWLRMQYLEHYFEYQNYSDNPTYNVFHKPTGRTNIDEILNFIW